MATSVEMVCGEKECARSKSDDPRHLLTCSGSGADVEDLTASLMQLRKVKALRAGDSVGKHDSGHLRAYFTSRLS
jgi:hypothetical protein